MVVKTYDVLLKSRFNYLSPSGLWSSGTFCPNMFKLYEVGSGPMVGQYITASLSPAKKACFSAFGSIIGGP